MEIFFRRAIANVTRHGDTDIFPFPIENHVFHDNPDETVALLTELHANFQGWLTTTSPAHEGALTPVSYTGFRWATQLDPLWNLYFLSLVLSIGENIESHRIPKQDKCVFSYRYSWDDSSSTIFDTAWNWRSFMERSLELAKNHQFVVVCDISEFYPRLGHHRLENALAHLNLGSDINNRIMGFLSNFSHTNSFGLPVGGPAARLLSELALNQIDQLLKLEGIRFCRFSDDFHLFAESMEDGFAKLLLLTEKLQHNQGLQLQKSKTRIMSSAEYISTSPIRLDDHDAPQDEDARDPTLADKARDLLRFSIRFDPYSPTASDDYEALKNEIEKFDIVGLLQAELAKSRIHVALAKKIVTAIKYLDPKQRDKAVLSLLENSTLLYPVFASILSVVRQVFDELSPETKARIIEQLLKMLKDGSHVLRAQVILGFAVRVLALFPSAAVQTSLVELYNNPRTNSLVRRDIILAMARLGGWHWLSDRRVSFRTMSPFERRAFIIASYTLKDEGRHWRKYISKEWTPAERLVRDWAANRSSLNGWSIPL